MRKLLLDIICLFATILVIPGCHDDIVPAPVSPDGRINVTGSIRSIRFGGDAESLTIHVSTSGKWHTKVSGAGFTVTPSSGDEGSYDLTITRTSDETANEKTAIGHIDIIIDGSKTSYGLDVDLLPRSKKTVIAYFFGTSLSYYFSTNIADMKQSVATGFLGDNRLLLFNQKSLTKAVIQEIFFDERTGEVCTYDLEEVALDNLTAESFSDNLKNIISYAPAESYSMILLGHSKAWLPKEEDMPETTLSIRARPAMNKVPGAEVTRDIGEKSNCLNIDEFSKGLALTGERFDCLYFDVCFMASIEAAYALRNNASYIIGSPCEIMGYGSPYHYILEPLFENDYEAVCYRYWDFYTNKYSGTKSGCIATIETAKLNAVADVVKRINAQPAAEGFNILSVQSYEGNSYSGKTGHWFYDVEDYCSSICPDRSLTDALTAALDECVTNRYHTERFYSAYNGGMNIINHYCGISITPDETCIEAIDRQLEDETLDSGTRTQLQQQKEMLNYYNPSLKRTDWYLATH